VLRVAAAGLARPGFGHTIMAAAGAVPSLVWVYAVTLRMLGFALAHGLIGQNDNM